jgi:hypothetical protein
MISEDNFHYAIENTEVILAPERRIDTFGSTSFRFHLVSELMDRVDEVRVRHGRLEAERPQLFTPGNFSHLLLDGFGEKARDFADWLEQHSQSLAILKYGFQFRKTDVVEKIVHEPMSAVVAGIKTSVQNSEGELNAIIRGVDDAWEVCLLKFAVDMIQESSGRNLRDFRRKGLL